MCSSRPCSGQWVVTWGPKASSLGLAPSMVAHLCHCPHCGNPGKVGWGGPWCSSSSPQGRKNQPDQNRADHGGGEGALSLRKLPLFKQAGKKGKGQLPPRCHIARWGRPGMASHHPAPAPPQPVPGAECVREQTQAPLCTGRGVGRPLSLPLPPLWAIWAPFGTLSSCHLGVSLARRKRERKKNVPVPALIS